MNDIDNNAMSNPTETNIIDDLTGFSQPASNDAGSKGSSLDDMFGAPGDTAAQNDTKPAGDPTESSSTSKPKMTPDEYMRSLQSKVDKSTNAITQLETQNKELAGAADFVNQLYEDQDVFNAFVAEINPELVKPRNPEDYIRDSLSKEFGSEFVPNESEENIRGSRTWLYNKRADDLYGEAITKSSKVPETISQLRGKRAQAQKDLQVKASQEKHAILSEFKWSDTDYSGFLNWANKVSTMDFAKLYQYGQSKKAQHTSSPNLTTFPGGTPSSGNAHDKELTEFFG